MIVAADVPAYMARFSEMYGHAAILRAYVGADDDRLRVVGQIQHGWSVGAGLDATPEPLYVWNDRSAKAAKDAGASSEAIVPIGAPYLYLPAAPSRMEIGRVTMGILALPQHSTSGHPFADAFRAWERYADWIVGVRAKGQFEQITVCLHENEYDDPAVRTVLNRHGLVSATCGSPRMSRTTFLDRFRALIHQHGIVTSNAIGTAPIYAAYEGVPVFIDGPEFERAPVVGTEERCYPETSDPAWIDREFPGWRCGWRDARPHEEDAKRELGFEHTRTASDLWTVLRLAVMP